MPQTRSGASIFFDHAISTLDKKMSAKGLFTLMDKTKEGTWILQERSRHPCKTQGRTYVRFLRNSRAAEPTNPVPSNNSVLGSGIIEVEFDIEPSKSKPEGSPDPPAGPVPA